MAVYRPTIGVRSVPTPSTQLRRTSPGFKNIGGLRAAPTPEGVPVKMRSPGSSGHTDDRCATSCGNREDQVGRAALLKNRATFKTAPQLHVVGIAKLVDGDQLGTQRGETTVGLPQRELRCGAGQLELALREVLSHRETRDVIPGVIEPDEVAPPSDHSDEFNLPVHGSGGERHGTFMAGQRRRELGEHRQASTGLRVEPPRRARGNSDRWRKPVVAAAPVAPTPTAPSPRTRFAPHCRRNSPIS